MSRTADLRRIGAHLDEHGFGSTAVHDLRDAAGVSLRTLYKRHESRDGVVAAALHDRAERYLRHLGAAPEGGAAAASGGAPVPPGDLLELFDRVVDWIEATDGRGCLLSRGAAEHPGPSPVAAVTDRYRERLLEHLCATARRGGSPPEVGRTALVVHEGLVWGAATLTPRQLRQEAHRLLATLGEQPAPAPD